MTRPVFRFAPSPNGHLHLGHAYSALWSQQAARQAGGRFFLRIEDIDTLRCREEFVDDMLRDLSWLGLVFDGETRRQSRHMHDYTAMLDRLERLRLVYPCFCSRQDIAATAIYSDPDGAPVYAGRCRLKTPLERMKLMTAGRPYSMRLDMAKAVAVAGQDLFFREAGEHEAAPVRIRCRPQAWGDVVVARKDIHTSYHIAVVTDDWLQGVTHVTRGVDLFKATDVHRLLQTLLELPEPVYMHHRLVLDDAGLKLSKSEGSRSLRSMREEGLSAADIRRALGFEV